MVGLVVVGLVALWIWGPLGTIAEPERLAELGRGLRGQWYSVPVAVAVFVAAGLIMAPQSLLIISSALIFGPFMGFFVAMIGSITAGVVIYFVGSATIGRLWRDREGGRLHRLSVALGSKGLVSMMLIRLIPFAHFSAVSLAAGASHIRFLGFPDRHRRRHDPLGRGDDDCHQPVFPCIRQPDPGKYCVAFRAVRDVRGAHVWVGRRYGSRLRSSGGPDSGPAQ